MDARQARSLLTVTGERLVRELNGVRCQDLELTPPTRKGIAVTRSFGRPVETLAEMLQATTFYATRAGEKLRRHGVLASHLQVFMHTSPFAAGPARSVSGIASMREPTSDTIELVRGASRATRRLWAGGYRYAKAGVILDDLVKPEGAPRALIDAVDPRRQHITWDLPGLGRSKPPVDGKIALEIFARDLAHLIKRVSPRPVILIGHSIGGMTIQTLARDHPELFRTRVAGVVLIDTTYTNPLRTMIMSKLALALRRPLLEPIFKMAIMLKALAWLGAWQGYLNGTAHIANRLQFGKYVTRSQLEHTTLLGTRNSPAILAKGNLAMFDWDSAGAVSQMTCPVLILGGDVDIVTKLEASEAIRNMASDAVLEPISGVNHMGFLERSGLYNARAIDFIAARCMEAQRGPAVTDPALILA